MEVSAHTPLKTGQESAESLKKMQKMSGIKARINNDELTEFEGSRIFEQRVEILKPITLKSRTYDSRF